MRLDSELQSQYITKEEARKTMTLALLTINSAYTGVEFLHNVRMKD
jgi:hypothetical protein